MYTNAKIESVQYKPFSYLQKIWTKPMVIHGMKWIGFMISL